MVFSFRVLLCLLSFFVLSCSQHQSRHGELVAAIDTGKDVFSIRGGEDALLAHQVFESSAEFVLEGYAAGEIRTKFKCNLINENGTRGKSFPIKASSHTMPQSGQKVAVPLFAMLPLEALQYREEGEGPLMCFAYIAHNSSGGYAHHAEDLLMHIRVQRDHDLAVYYDNTPFSASWEPDMQVQPRHLRDMFAKVRNENKQDLKFYMQCGNKKSAPMEWSASGLHLWAMYNSIEQTSAMPAQSKCLVFAEKAGSIVAYAEAFTLHNPRLPLQTRQIKSFDTVPFSLNKDLFFKDQVREKVPVSLRAKDDFEQSVVAQHSDTKWQCLVHTLNTTEGHESFFESQKEPGSQSHHHVYKKHSSEFLKHGMKWRTLMESRSSFEVVEVHNPNSFPLEYDIVNSYKYHEQHIRNQVDDYKLPLRQARFAVCAQAFTDLSTVYESKSSKDGFYDTLEEVQSIQLAANESKVFVVQKPLSHPCALTPFFYSSSSKWMLRHRPTEAISQSLVRKALGNSDKAFDTDWVQDIASHDSYYCWTQKERVKDPNSWAGGSYDSMLSAKHINTAAKRTYVGYDLGVQLRLSRESGSSLQHQRDATLDIQNLIAPKQIEAQWSNKVDNAEGWALHKTDVEIISVKELSPF